MKIVATYIVREEQNVGCMIIVSFVEIFQCENGNFFKRLSDGDLVEYFGDVSNLV